MPTDPRIALVTGASSGFGKVTASLLAARGIRVFGTSRAPRGDRGDGFEMLELDVDSDASVDRCVSEVQRTAGAVDVLVNNAGQVLTGSIEETSTEEAKAHFETNFFGAVRMTRAVLPSMRQRRRGWIVNVGSIAGTIPVPFEGFYGESGPPRLFPGPPPGGVEVQHPRVRRRAGLLQDEPRQRPEDDGEPSRRLRGRAGTSRGSVAGAHRRRRGSEDRRPNDRGHRREPVAPPPVSGREGEAVPLVGEDYARRKLRGRPETPLEIGSVKGRASEVANGKDRTSQRNLGGSGGLGKAPPDRSCGLATRPGGSEPLMWLSTPRRNLGSRAGIPCDNRPVPSQCSKDCAFNRKKMLLDFGINRVEPGQVDSSFLIRLRLIFLGLHD